MIAGWPLEIRSSLPGAKLKTEVLPPLFFLRFLTEFRNNMMRYFFIHFFVDDSAIIIFPHNDQDPGAPVIFKSMGELAVYLQ